MKLNGIKVSLLIESVMILSLFWGKEIETELSKLEQKCAL